MQRVDKYLVEKGFFESRKKAQAAIMAGLVSISSKVINKPSTMVSSEADINVKERPRYVSRGALKLKKALDVFSIAVAGKIVLDAGASTGGFSQVLLERGVKKVIAVDVGYGQFHYKLRKDKRIRLFERTNIRYFKLEEDIDFAVADLSFISVDKIIDNLLAVLKKDAELIILIKPQFEVDRKHTKKGVVRDATIHKMAIKDIVDLLEKREISVYGLTFSPIKGPKGNIEFFVYLKRNKSGLSSKNIEKLINNTVDKAHSVLK